jgi:sortase A
VSAGGAAREVSRVGLFVLAAVAISVVLQPVVVGRLEHRAAQQQAYDRLRKDIADSVAPLGATIDGKPVHPGRPVALLVIPSIHLREVVLEGTSGGVLMSGPGHRRDSPLPGQAGTSVIYGRQAAYGGPFRRLGQVKIGASITVTTQAGTSTFRVIGKRHEGDLVPQPVKEGGGRLLLVTAAGTPFVPSGVLRVDADLTTAALPTDNAPVPALSSSERLMAPDTTTLWALVLWLQALIFVAVGAVWAWHRWGRYQALVVLVPVTALVAYFGANQFMKLLPNLL